MNDPRIHSFIAALGLPASCRVDQRVPKKMLIDHGAHTAADKRLLNDCIESVQWLAALKPHTVGVPIWRSDEREYLEIAVLAVTFRNGESTPPAPAQSASPASVARMTELLHRAVPYPVLLLMVMNDAPHGLTVSAGHKRRAHNEAGKVVLDGDVLAAALTGAAPGVSAAFLHAVALGQQPQTHLLALYEGWMACLLALQVAQHTGRFLCQNGFQPLLVKRKQLQKYEQLLADAAHLRSQAGKVKQMAQQVELNLALQRVQAQLAQARSQLSPDTQNLNNPNNPNNPAH